MRFCRCKRQFNINPRKKGRKLILVHQTTEKKVQVALYWMVNPLGGKERRSIDATSSKKKGTSRLQTSAKDLQSACSVLHFGGGRKWFPGGSYQGRRRTHSIRIGPSSRETITTLENRTNYALLGMSQKAVGTRPKRVTGENERHSREGKKEGR